MAKFLKKEELSYLYVLDTSIWLRNLFRCSNGQCIWYFYRCDGNRECNDGTDEDDCGSDIIYVEQLYVKTDLFD